jgi:hypothetical protein
LARWFMVFCFFVKKNGQAAHAVPETAAWTGGVDGADHGDDGDDIHSDRVSTLPPS